MSVFDNMLTMPEIINNVPENSSFKAALFDFDGTLSLIRQGWQDIMIPYFCEEIYSSGCTISETDEEIKAIVTDFVDELTGKQTIFQCIRLKDEIENRGGNVKNEMDYKNEYLRRLFLRIQDIREGLSDGRYTPEKYLVKGTVEFLEALKSHGVSLYLASGTDEPQVREEASLLGLDYFFDGNIFGARDEHALACSKELVIKDLLNSNNINGNELLAFGDGFVEIELVKNIGGYAIAVATDEINNSGVDPAKRERLLRAGADVVIPDFANFPFLINHLFG